MSAQVKKNNPTLSSIIYISNKAAEDLDLFKDNQDREVFLNYLKEYLSPPLPVEHKKKMFSVNGRTFMGVPHQPKNYSGGIELLAYDLTNREFQLIIKEKVKGTLEKLMRSLNTRYAIYYNKKYQRQGSIYAGTYKSSVIDNMDKLVFLSRTLHNHSPKDNNNAKLFSSYPYYVEGVSNPWIKTQIVLSYFNEKRKDKFENKRSYKDFVEKNSQKRVEKEVTKEIVPPSEKPLERSIDKNSKPRSFQVDQPPVKALQNNSKSTAYFAANAVLFLFLVTMGVRNIKTKSIDPNIFSDNKLLATEEDQTTQPQVSGASDENLEAPFSLYQEEATKEADIKNEVVEPDDANKPKKDSPKIEIVADPEMNVNVRREPSYDSSIVAKAKNEDVFVLISKLDGWYQIELDDGTGFVSSDFASELSEKIEI